MKKFIYLFMALGFIFTACDPMEDIYDVIDAQKEIINGEVTFSLSDEDYDDLDLSYGNFSNINDAKAMIPGLLTDKYPVWGDGSLATVTFKWYNKVNTYSKNIYVLSDDEHNEVTGGSYGNFDRDYHVTNFLEAKYPDAESGDFHSLRYNYYAGGETTLTDGFYFNNGEWNRITGFTPNEYKAMGNGYPNFGGHDEAETKIPIALIDKYKFAGKEAGDIVGAMYELYKGGGVTKSYTSNFIFDGNAWSKYNNVALETIKFGHDGSTWVPDNTIKLTLSAADYAFLGTEYGDPGYYNNFDVREGKENYKTPAEILAYINRVLLNNYPGMAEGQKFAVKYDVYSGANEVWEMKVILSGGAYVLQ